MDVILVDALAVEEELVLLQSDGATEDDLEGRGSGVEGLVRDQGLHRGRHWREGRASCSSPPRSPTPPYRKEN